MPGDNKHVARMQATWVFLREAVAAQQGLLIPDQGNRIKSETQIQRHYSA